MKKQMNLHMLFLEELADLLHAENQLIKVLPKMAKAAHSRELSRAFTSHLKETKNHISRLEKVFKSVNAPVKKQTCEAMKGLLEEGAELMKELKGTPALDAGLIAAAQKVEHYEIATYGAVRAWAKKMGHKQAFTLLTKTMEEESGADEKLTKIAESVANEEAE